MSRDRLHLLCANRAGLHFFKRMSVNQEFEKIKSGVLSNLGVHSVFVTPSGHILAQETGSNDLVLLRSNGEELARHKGFEAEDCGKLIQKVESVRRNAFIGTIFNKVIWFKGKADLAIVNLNDFSYTEIKDIVPYIEGQSESVIMQIVHTKDCENICFTFSLLGICCIGLITKASKEPDRFPAADKFPKSKILLLKWLQSTLYRSAWIARPCFSLEKPEKKGQGSSW